MACVLTGLISLGAGCGLLGDDGEEFGTRRDLVRRISEVRAEGRVCGTKEFPAAGPLAWNDNLAAAAVRHVRDLSSTSAVGHTGSDGSTPGERIADTGYEAVSVGEIVADGEGWMDRIVRAWLESPGHCAVIMNANFSEAGGAVQGLAWAVDFARPR